jgi:hypothetical protein
MACSAPVDTMYGMIARSRSEQVRKGILMRKGYSFGADSFPRRAVCLTGFLTVVACFFATGSEASAETCHVWEKVEIVLKTEKPRENPYKDVEVWVDLTGPGSQRRCYGFWDGGETFRVRVLATTPGRWSWRSGSDPRDPGLNGKTGDFAAVPWTEQEKAQNPNRRGMIRPSANGHAFNYADGTPFFLLGDTWWATATFRYPWHDDERERPIGPGAGFKDYVKFREEQGFNCIAMIAAFPNWANDGRPNDLTTPDGTVLRSAWRQAATKSAKDMTDENGNRAFFFPGRVPGFEDYFPDVDRINPDYFRNLDKKIDYLNASGFVPFIEVSRRDIGQAWKRYYEWPESYTRYIQYIWSRYQANICLFSPIHFDWEGKTVPANDWNLAANRVIEKYGAPPFDTLVSCNSAGSSLHWFDRRESPEDREKSKSESRVNAKAKDRAKWITFHQIGNRRQHNNYALLTEIFNAAPPLPAINGEPYYAGMEDAPGGTDTSALYSRSGMYGSVLSGGFGGHIYGAGGWDGGMWGGNVEAAAENHIWNVIRWPSGDQMQHLRTFVLSERRKYQSLVPRSDLISPNRSGKPEGYMGWAYCACTADKDFFLLYFEKDCPRATVSGLSPRSRYRARWFDPRTGKWQPAGRLAADRDGQAILPGYPDGSERSGRDWGLQLLKVRD